jgi:energy-coupling factor transporter ATP-binding protein EcfA2
MVASFAGHLIDGPADLGVDLGEVDTEAHRQETASPNLENATDRIPMLLGGLPVEQFDQDPVLDCQVGDRDFGLGDRYSRHVVNVSAGCDRFGYLACGTIPSVSTGVAPSAALRASLDALVEHVESTSFTFPSAGQDDRQDLRNDLAWNIREYLLPRLLDLEAPLLVVVIGSTGSGKSTLVNSLAQARVSEPGTIRPTTRVPVIWTHTSHAQRYEEGFLTGYGTAAEAEHPLRIVTDDHPLLDGVTILDAPDFDSVVEGHREMVEELLAVADLTVFVTSAQRYADAVPWEFLERASRRRLPILFVLNRLPAHGADEIASDYRDRLLERRVISRSDTFEVLRIPEQRIAAEHGGLSLETVATLRSTLETMSDPDRRRRVVVASTYGAVRDAVDRAGELSDALESEAREIESLRIAARRAYQAQVDEIGESLRGGTLIRAEVLRRWQEFLGTGELLKALTAGAGRIRRWAARVFGGNRRLEEVSDEAGDEIVAAVVRRADLAAGATAAAWELDGAGKTLLAAGGGDLWRHDGQTPERAEIAIQDWIAALADLIAEQGAGKRRWAQVASFGINATAVVVLMAVFAQTGGITGAEFGVAAGAAAAQQKILEHVFGSAAARSLIEEARRQLVTALEGVLRRDERRFAELVESYGPDLDASEQIRLNARNVQTAARDFYGS